MGGDESITSNYLKRANYREIKTSKTEITHLDRLEEKCKECKGMDGELRKCNDSPDYCFYVKMQL